MNHHWPVRRVVGTDVGKIEAHGQIVVHLHGAELPFATDHVLDDEIDFRTVEGSFTRFFRKRHAERFRGVLIAHFGGDFPLWLAPEQVRIVPIRDKVLDYAKELQTQLLGADIRVSLDAHSDKLGAKIRRAELETIPYTLVIGQKEAEAQSVSVRSRAKGDEGVLKVADVIARFKHEVATRTLPEKTKAPGATSS